MLNRKVNLLTALLIGVASLIGGIFITSLLLRSYLRSAAPPEGTTTAVTSRSTRVASSAPIAPAVSDAAPADRERGNVAVQKKAGSTPSPAPVRQAEPRRSSPLSRFQPVRAEGQGEEKRGKEYKKNHKEKRRDEKRGKGKKRGHGNDD